MHWAWYLFGFKGRINRAQFWLSVPVMIGWMMLSGLLEGVLGLLLLAVHSLAAGRLPSGRMSFQMGFDKILNLFNPAS